MSFKLDFPETEKHYPERDALNQAICNFINYYLQFKHNYPVETTLAINLKTFELKLYTDSNFSSEWSINKIQTLYRNNADNTGFEIDTDAIYKLASSYFFIL